MSSENVETVRKCTEAYRRGDFEEATAWMSPDIEWDMSGVQMPDAAVYRGFEGLTRFREQWEESWESTVLEPQEFIDAGDQVVAVIRQSGRGKLSGADVEHGFAQLWTLREGVIVRMAIHPDRETALAAAETAERARR